MSNRWNGYSINELRYRKDILILKKELKKNSLKILLHEKIQEFSTSQKVGFNPDFIGGILNIIDYVTTGYKIFNKIFLFCKKFKK